MSEPLQLVVLLVIEELQSGDFLAWPFAEPDKVAHGRTREEAIEQQELFLREHLAKAPGAALAIYDPHAEAELELVEVPLQRDDLPDRVSLPEPLTFPCLIVPAGADAWAVVLNLRHAVWIPGGLAEPELRAAKIRDEVERVVSARELDGHAFLGLLSGADPFELHPLTIEVEREERAGAEARAAARRRRARERSESDARKLLGRVGTALVEELRLRRRAPVLHREREIASLDALLRGPERLALMLVGPELAGKTALLHGMIDGWLQGSRSRGRLATLPEIIATSGAQLVAGQSGFGQLEQRVNDVMAAAEMLDAILYFDNLGDLFARTSGELGDVASSMRPWLERGRVRLLGEITPELLEHHEKRHVGFFAYLNRIPVTALDADQTRAILEARARYDRRSDPDRPTLSLPPQRDAVTPLVDLAERYLSYRAFPGKAVRFYASLRATQEGELGEGGEPRAIGPDEVYRGFSIHSGIPMFLLREDRTLEYQRILDYFGARVIGQSEAIGRVAETLCTVKAGLQPAAKPLATFLFVGPTGVGKTEVAKTLARFLFGSPERMIRFDMSEYMDPLAAERLIRGTDRDDGVMTRKVRQQPFCVVLLDEIEKAHPAVFDLLLQVCGEGRLSDARGRTTWFHNAIIIMTSNLGAAHRRPSTGFGGGERDRDPASDQRAAERYYLDQVDTHFRPEFVNRIDRVIPFHPLDRAQILHVATVSLARVRERDGVGERGIELEVSETTLARLATEGYSDTYGARALRRELEDRLVAPLARTLAKLGDRAEGGTIRVEEAPSTDAKPREAAARRKRERERVLTSETQDSLTIEVAVPSGRAARRTLDALNRVSTLRRSAAAALDLNPIRELRDRLRVLVAELGYGAHKRKGSRSAWEHAADLGRLQSEHGRLVGTLERLDELRESIESAEELTIAALYEGEPADLYQNAAEDAHRALQLAIVDALLLENERHTITVHLQEQDPRGAFLIYLLPLLDCLGERGWSATFHVFGDKDKAEVRWPEGRAWGPPRSPAWLRRRLLAEFEPGADKAAKRRFRDLLMCVQGRHAGAVIDSQLGLFRYEHPWQHEGRRDKDQRPTHLRCRFVSRSATLNAEAWDKGPVEVGRPLGRKQLDATPKLAHFDERGMLDGKITTGRMALTPAQFWPQIEQVLFASLVERAFEGDHDEAGRD
ncbi:ATP-dependent Clp protease ATP-binding subunit ClpC [Enhygromyxa salina]|uniref:ATP-dependent Clp protease ATP-binding subunit ClpC n=1 Tax=Enhygromyxa salina TaxID=215803 RepID=A0A2S9XH35_9BACT|nr:AAA family ATPase [Enhygromyxa salina]PRP92194.1 ATP-dependent Clp protease ATP-binding subunit ClpC [Enhygromyxa salina]